VFVTGAYGLLGSWLVKELQRRAARVTVLKRDEPAVSALEIEGVEALVNVVRGDVADASLMERVLAEYEIDSVFHLAAQTLVGVANRSPVATFETNIRGTWILLEACRRARVRSVVVAASDKAYGIHDHLPYQEDFALQPRYPYDVSKAATDMIARSYWHTYGLPVAVTRLANLYGGGDLNMSRLIPEAAVATIEGRRPVIRSDGTAQRDFLYVEDAVDAYLAIWEMLDGDRGCGEAFNAGGDRPYPVLEVVRLLCSLSGTTLEPDIQGTGIPSGEIARQWVDSTKLRTTTGWAPRVTLEDGLVRTLSWYREHLTDIRAQSGPDVARGQGAGAK
jgi:CDP-glucose 4,6-dehydratase